MATALRLPDAAAEVQAWVEVSQRKSLLRFITCGSVDDGKSTLIGRLLYDSKMLFEDQLATLQSDSLKSGTQGQKLDLALLVDGLAAEREQGITIDVAYRFFATDKRKFIVADTPGHEQYTRNMVTGASNADLAVILIDARKGVLTQTRRHSFLVSLLGIRRIVLAINKMDLVGYSQSRFDSIVADYRAFAAEAGIEEFVAIPVSGLDGDNVSRRSAHMDWYSGPSLLEHLETVQIRRRAIAGPFRMAVQWVNRPHSGFRGYAGRIAAGSISPGDPVTILPSGQTSRVDRIVTFDGDLDTAGQGQSVTLTFTDEIDCSRGNLVTAGSPADVGDRVGATLMWMAAAPLVAGRSYWLKSGAQTLSATVNEVRNVVDVNTMVREPGRPLALNDIGDCALHLDRAVPLLPYEESRELGGFILIDKISNATVAAGLIRTVTRGDGGQAMDQEEGRILWASGASQAERRQAAEDSQRKLKTLGRPTLILDEEMMAGLNMDIGDRDEALRRVREVAKLMTRAGVHVLITYGASDEEAHPGRRLDRAGREGEDEWVI
ncbi:MAG: adenylyl-sulfate kinase [Alphaproteobacteria bacterium]|nr:adenylyl-sulfate kinase [Alphaproteobacteria bacterium]